LANKKTNSSKKIKGKVEPNQRYYTIIDENNKPVTYNQIAPEGDGKKEKKHISIPVDMSYTASLFPRTPMFSPISRLKFGQQLAEKIQSAANEKIASGSAGGVISVGNIGSTDSLTKLSEEELLKKFGTKNITSNFERPYDDIDYTTFHDAIRSDGMTRICAIKRTQYVVGEFTDIEFVPNYLINDKDEKNKIQDSLNNNKLLNSLKLELKKIDEDVHFYLALHGIILHYTTFGQGLVAREHDSDDIPVALKILSGMRIGRLFKDKTTWKIKGIEYLDYSSANQENILLAEDLIYVPNLDFNLGPNTSGYGLSNLETIRHIAEQNVILNQMDIKEGNFKYHTPKVIVTVVNSDTPQDIVDLNDALEKSQAMVTDLDATPHLIENTMNVLELAEERDMNDEAISRYLDIPSLLAGFENAQVKAAGGATMSAWSQSSLLKEHEIIRVYVQPQWYMRNLKAIIKRRLRRLGILTTQDVNGKRVEVLAPQSKDDIKTAEAVDEKELPKLSENGLPIDKDGAEIIPDIEGFNDIRDFIPFLDHLEKLPFTIKMTFEPINIDDFLTTTASVVSLKNARIIDNIYAYKLLKFKDLEANPPQDLMDLGLQAEDPNAFGPGKNKGGVGDLGSLDVEKLVTQKGTKPRPRLNTNK
jgi:hypothetical protein